MLAGGMVITRSIDPNEPIAVFTVVDVPGLGLAGLALVRRRRSAQLTITKIPITVACAIRPVWETGPAVRRG